MNIIIKRDSTDRHNFLLLAITSLFCIMFLFLCYILIYDAFHFIPKNDKRWHDPNTIFDSDLGWIQISNGSALSFGKVVTSNEEGFRSGPIDHSKKHILLVGDSVVWGFGVNDNETLAYFLNNMVTGASDSYQVQNLGVSGYGIDQYYLFLKEKISKTNPAVIVVVIYTGNDLWETSQNNAYGKSKPLLVLEKSKLVNMNANINKYSCNNLFTFSYILNKYDFLRRMRSHLCKDIKRDNNQTTEVINFIFEDLGKISSEHNSSLLFVLSPSYNDYQAESENLSYFKKILKDANFSYLDYYDINNKSGINMSEMYNHWNNEIDQHHYSPAGNKRLAKIIFERIKWEID